jgi:hypothetical protein
MSNDEGMTRLRQSSLRSRFGGVGGYGAAGEIRMSNDEEKARELIRFPSHFVDSRSTSLRAS